MKRLAARLALAAALLGSTFAGTALAQPYNSQRGQDDSWRQDGSRDNSRERSRPALVSFEGRWVADNRSMDTRSGQGNFRGRGGMDGILLPEFIRIDQKPSMVRISNRQNRLIQEIMIGGRFDPRNRSGYGRQDNLLGRWRGSTLIVEHTGPRGVTITQTFALENRGRTLVVRTRREGAGPRGTVEFSTVYRRA